MKLLKKNSLLFIFVLLVFIDYLGLYQWSNIEVDDISITKPFGYKYSSASYMDDNSTFSIFKNTMGLRNKFKSSENNLLSLDFKKKFLNENTRIFFSKLSNIDKNFMSDIDINNTKCTQKNIIKKNAQYVLKDMIIYKSKIKFYIISDTKDDLIYFYKQICE